MKRKFYSFIGYATQFLYSMIFFNELFRQDKHINILVFSFIMFFIINKIICNMINDLIYNEAIDAANAFKKSLDTFLKNIENYIDDGDDDDSDGK